MITLKSEHLFDLSMEALGVLSTMVNLPECDYVTVEELCEFSPNSTKEVVLDALNELVSKNYVTKVNDKYYAVVKTAVLQYMRSI